jgi:hypothetical protein
MAAPATNDILVSNSSIVERYGWSHTMNLMLATLTARDRFETYALEAEAERQTAGPRTPKVRHGGLLHRVTSMVGHLRLTGRSAGA